MDKHFTATTYIFDKGYQKTLLHWHRKLSTWLPPGGHLEENETPLEAAKREVEEEAGITELEYIHPNGPLERIDDRCEILPMPHYLLSEEIEVDHYHLDWIFFAVIENNSFSKDMSDEEFKWFTIPDLKAETKIFNNVREIAIRGIEKMSG